MNENGDLKSFYEQLGALELDKTCSVLSATLVKVPTRAHTTLAVAGIDTNNLTLGDPSHLAQAQNSSDLTEAAGISTFRHVSIALQEQVCGNSGLLPAAGITEASMKQALASLLIGLGSGWAAAIAGIGVYLFFNDLKPEICARWSTWNSASTSDPYQLNPKIPATVFERKGLYSGH